MHRSVKILLRQRFQRVTRKWAHKHLNNYMLWENIYFFWMKTSVLSALLYLGLLAILLNNIKVFFLNALRSKYS